MSSPLLTQADQALARGDVSAARDLLAKASSDAPGDAQTWLKLAAMCRAAGDLSAALDAVHGALAAAPLDFTALLLRATLLARLQRAEADEAFARALAQKPSGTLPPAIAGVVAQAEERVRVAAAAKETALVQLGASAGRGADPRIARFASNIVRRTRPYHSEPTHYHYPGLIEREFHDRHRFPWLATLEQGTATIRGEFEQLLATERAELVPYVQYAAHEPLAQWKPLNHSRDWTAIHLLQNGRPVEANAGRCPRTMDLLRALPQPNVPGCSPNAMFSLLAPGTHIPPHCGVANTRLVCHLPLVVPPQCWFRVGAETREWRCGEAFVFDDTIEHEAMNGSDTMRVVLILDVWHFDLDAADRAAVSAMMAADVGAADMGL